MGSLLSANNVTENIEVSKFNNNNNLSYIIYIYSVTVSVKSFIIIILKATFSY